MRARATPARAKTRSAARRIAASLARVMPPLPGARLFGAEEAVAGIAEPRDDIGVIVERRVDRGGVDRHVRMLLLHRRNARRRGDEADEFDRLGAALLETADRGAGRMAGRQHRIDDDDEARGNVVRHLQIILYGGERLWVAVDAGMP